MRAIVIATAVAASACQVFFDTDVLTSEPALLDAGTLDEGGGPALSDGGAVDDGAPLDDGGIEVPRLPATSPFFTDDFARADSTAVGNGWSEKNDEAFVISASSAMKLRSELNYRDNLVYRTERDVLDAYVSAVFDVAVAPPGSPQVHARIQRDTVAIATTLDSYLVYVEDGSLTQATIARQRGAVYSVRLARFTFEPLQAGVTYRLRLRVAGVDPVMVEAALDRVEEGGTFRTIGHATTTDATPDRLTTAGLVGFSGDTDSDRRFAYRRFEAWELP